MTVRQYTDSDIPAMIEIWNEVVEEGAAYPQEDFLNENHICFYLFSHIFYCNLTVLPDSSPA